MIGSKPDAEAADPRKGVVEERSVRIEAQGEPSVDCAEVTMRT